jgi:hypothetical protein
VNDGKGALTLTVGGRTSTQTGGAEPEPRRTCGATRTRPRTRGSTRSAAFGIGSRAGERATVDTAGSSLNTTVAGYLVDGDRRTEIACVDDDEPLVTSYHAGHDDRHGEGRWGPRVGGWARRARQPTDRSALTPSAEGPPGDAGRSFPSATSAEAVIEGRRHPSSKMPVSALTGSG